MAVDPARGELWPWRESVSWRARQSGEPDVFGERRSMDANCDWALLPVEVVGSKDTFLEATGYRLSCFLITYVSAKQT